jgi:hypothetical protein
MGKTTVLAMIASLVPLFGAAALEITLVQRTGQETVTVTERIREREDGFEATVESSLGEIDRVVLDRSRSTVEWSRSFPGEGTALKAVRKGRSVSVVGTFRNKPVSWEKDFGDLPWYEYQELSYPALLDSREAQTEFWTINRADLKPTRFHCERQAGETITVSGRAVEALHFHLTVYGIPAILFHSSVWLRKEDGVFLRIEVPPVLGLPATRVELTAEKP